MKTQIAVAVAVLSLTGVAAAAEHIDIGAAQQRGEQGFAPTSRKESVTLGENTRPVAQSIGMAQQRGEQGLSPTGREESITVDENVRPVAQSIGEAQQMAQSGQGYTSAKRADAGQHASVAR